MIRLIDITGQRFSNLVAVRYTGRSKWVYRCDCGNETIALASNVASGNTKTCGCRKGDVLRARQTTHGHAPRGRPSPTYVAWYHAIQRCENPKNKRFSDYGGRGITVCYLWHDFQNFLADMGPKPRGYILDRIDNDLGYTPGNCRWATVSESRLNQRRMY